MSNYRWRKVGLVVRAILAQPLMLKELLLGITDENLPGEWNTGPDLCR